MDELFHVLGKPKTSYRSQLLVLELVIGSTGLKGLRIKL
jgi:hypothetical protein